MSAPLDPTLQNIIRSQTLQWVFVGGKGGVGKTTVSCSLALALAARRHSVLLISTDPAHNLSDAFGQKFSKAATQVRGVPNLYAMEVEPPSRLDPDAAAAAAGAAGTLPPELQEMFGDSQSAFAALNELVDMVPGIDEAMSFGMLMQSVQRMEHDIIVFDTAPTGHTMRLLGFPGLLDKALDKMKELHDRFGGMLGPMSAMLGAGGPGGDIVAALGDKLAELRDVVKKVVAQFKDKQRTTFVCVCIPEFLSVYETERLVQELRKYEMGVTNIVVNQVLDLPDDDSSGQISKLYDARVAIQRKYLDQIDELYAEDFHITRIPILSEEVRSLSNIEQFAKRIMGEVQTSFGDAVESPHATNLRNIIEQRGLKWVFVGGKGGVGKTTTSCALAVSLARDRQKQSNKKILIISTDPAHNLSDAFNQQISPGGLPTQIQSYDNLYAMEVEPGSSAESLANVVLPEEILPRGVLKDLASSIPGIDEAVSFAQIIKLVKSMDFDTVVFDTAPTGHTLRLLNFPTLLGSGLQRLTEMKERFGPLLAAVAPPDGSSPLSLENASRKMEELKLVVEQVGAQLRDVQQTTFVCVAIAEFLSVYETERLVQELATLGIDVRNVVVNQLLPPEEGDRVGLLRARAKMQERYIEQVKELYPPTEFHVTEASLLGYEVRGVASLRSYAAKFLLPK